MMKFLDNILNQYPIPTENGNEVQSTISGTEVEGESIPEATILAQVARCSTKYVVCRPNDYPVIN